METRSTVPLKLAAIFFIGIVMWYWPISAEIPLQGWRLFSIFTCTMIGIVINPLPISAIALMGAAVCSVTGVLTTEQILSGFGQKVVWLLIFSFLIARSIIKTGLGKRLAYWFIAKMGQTTLGLSYGLVLTEFLLSPLIPSITARGGGIIYPIALSLSNEYSKEQTPGKAKKTLGYIMMVCFQANVITSAMFLTAMAANPLIQSLAFKAGVVISWNTWAAGSILPGVISLIVMPLVIYLIHPPAIKSSPSAPQHAYEALKEMGKLTKHEIALLCTLIFLIAGWTMETAIGLDSTAIALIGVVILLITGVLEWNDGLNEKSAWDSLVWFGVVVMLSEFLAKFGIVKWLSMQVAQSISVYSPTIAVPALILIYFYLHYMFASVTAHVTVLFTTFLLLIASFGTPMMIATMPLVYLSTLSGGLTHYGTSSAPVFFGAKSVSTKEWWSVGFFVGIVNLLIWGVVGGLWWKYLGWY